jgi:hypothetical protein
MAKSLLHSVLVRCGDSRLVLLVVLLGRFHFFGFKAFIRWKASELADELDAARANEHTVDEVTRFAGTILQTGMNSWTESLSLSRVPPQ